MEPCDWLALWCTDGFDVLVEVRPSLHTIQDEGSPALAGSAVSLFGLVHSHLVCWKAVEWQLYLHWCLSSVVKDNSVCMAAIPPTTPVTEGQHFAVFTHRSSSTKLKLHVHLCNVLGARCGLQGPEGVCGAGVAHAVWNQRLRTHRRHHEDSPWGHTAKGSSAGAESCLWALWGVRPDGSRPRAPQVEFSSTLFGSLRSVRFDFSSSYRRSLPSRFFYTHIWRQWDEEDEDDDFDYFVRCVEPRLRLYVHVSHKYLSLVFILQLWTVTLISSASMTCWRTGCPQAWWLSTSPYWRSAPSASSTSLHCAAVWAPTRIQSWTTCPWWRDWSSASSWRGSNASCTSLRIHC